MSHDSNRPRRIAELLKRELAQLIAQELNDPRIGPVTLTAVDVTPDLKLAKVFYTQLGETEASSQGFKETTEALNHASGFLRHCLRARVDLRSIPALRFKYDESVARGARISALLNQAHGDTGGNGADQ